MPTRWQGAFGTAVVLLLTAALVVLDITVGAVHRWGATHSITVDTVCGVLIVLITVLVINQVLARRSLDDRKRAIAAQAAILSAQAARTVRTTRDALTGGEEEEENARDELRSYMTMLLIAAPLLIDASTPRVFLEEAQTLAGQLARTLSKLHDDDFDPTVAGARLDDAVAAVRAVASPLVAVLTADQRSAVTPDPQPSP